MKNVFDNNFSNNWQVVIYILKRKKSMYAHVTKIIGNVFINKSEKKLNMALKSFPLDS